MQRTAFIRCQAGRGVGYGPFSAIAKARARGEQSKQQSAGEGPVGCCGASSPDMMKHVQLDMNANLRKALASLHHPQQLEDMPYQGAEWRLAMIRLYRTIMRLHNKTVAVSVAKARNSGPESSVSAVTGVAPRRPESTIGRAEDKFLRASAQTPSSGGGEDPTDSYDYLERYLLTPQQREFGNKFVMSEFQRHTDADAVSATTFYASWYQYVLQLASGVTSRELTAEEQRLLSTEQKDKLKELRGAFTSMRIQDEPGYML